MDNGRPLGEFEDCARSCSVFTTQVDAWLDVVPRLLQEGKIEEKEIGSVPLVYYVIGDIDRAIEYAEHLNSDPAFSDLSKRARTNIDFNRATFLIEREYHHPTKNQAMKDGLRQEIEKVLRNPDLRSMSATLDVESSIEDTMGLLKITFARTQDEARAGIEHCVKARGLSTPEEQTVSNAYADLNLRLGWRRYFELEGK